MVNLKSINEEPAAKKKVRKKFRKSVLILLIS